MGDQVQMQNVERDEMLALSSQILRDLGTPPDDALSVADSLVQAQEAGHASHGVIRLIEYTSFVERGWVIPTGQPTIVSDRGAVALIAQGSSSSAIMTMTTMRLTTFIVSLFLLAKYRTLGGLSKKNIPILIVIGAADFIANLFLGVATTKGLVSLAVVLGSLYPIVTALLAFKLLQERLHKVQYVGIAFAITGVAFIAAG